jgi:hypothetical protein
MRTHITLSTVLWVFFPILIGCTSAKTSLIMFPTPEERTQFEQQYEKPQKRSIAILPVVYEDGERLLAAEKFLAQTFYQLGQFNVLSLGSVAYDVKKLQGESIPQHELEKLKVEMTQENPPDLVVFATDLLATEGQKRSVAGALLDAEGGMLGKGGLQKTASFEMRVRVINLQTGEIVFDEYEKVDHAMGNKTKEELSIQTMVDVLKNMAKKITGSFPMEGTIVDVLPENRVQIDMGQDFRLKKKTRFYVFRQSKVGLPIQIGEIEVTQVQNTHAVGKVRKVSEPGKNLRIGDRITSQKL